MNYGIKKITALLTVFVLVLCMGISPVFSEDIEESTIVIDSVSLKKAKTLEALGLLPGSVTAEDFCTKEGITRAEITSVMVKMAGMDKTAAENTTVYFTDVDDESVYAADIATALSMGIINGNGDYTFRPDEYVTYDALVKMAVATLGYDTQAQLEGGFPTGYLQMAARIGLSKSAPSSVSGSFVTEFLYAMLDIDISYITGVGTEVIYMTTEGKTLLTENLKMYTVEGIVDGNKSTDLYGSPMLPEGQISIDEVAYNYEGSSMEFLGMSVKAYCRENNDKAHDDIVYIEVSDRNRVIVADAEGSSYSNGTFTYYDKNDKKRTASVYEGAPIIYNGRAITDTNFDMARLIPDEGVITLIDNRSAGSCNVVIVNAYTNVVVDTVDTYQEVIYDKYLSSRSIKLDGKDYEIYDAESGKELKLSDLAEYNVLTVMKSDDDSYIIKRSTKTLSGAIERTATNPDKVYIDGVIYRLSNSYITSGQELPAAGDSTTFLLDINGRIAGRRVLRDSSIKVGLVTALAIEGVFATPVIKVMTMVGEEQVFYFADTVEVDGIRIKSEETDANNRNKLVTAVSRGTQGYSERLAEELPDGQIIRYTLNSDNKINMIDTNYQTPGVENDNTLRRSLSYDAGVGSGDGLYFKNKNANGKEIVGDESIVFVVTLPFSGKIEDSISVAAGSYFTNSKYILESYVYTENKIGADAVICYKDEATAILGSYSNELFVDNIGEAVGKDGKTIQTQISGWYIGSYSTFLLKENAKIDFEIKKGDLIGFSTNADGEIYLADHIYSVEKDKYTMTPEFRKTDSNPMDDFYYVNAAAGTFDNGRVFAYGHLYHRFENDIIMTKTETISESAMKDSNNQVKVNIGSAHIYVYDKNDDRNPVRLGTKADLLSYKTDPKNPSRIIVRASNALAKTVFIIK